MCFGGGSKSAAPAPAPAPTPTPTFSYTRADNSNNQQRRAASIASTTGQNKESFGADLASASGTTPAATSNTSTTLGG